MQGKLLGNHAKKIKCKEKILIRILETEYWETFIDLRELV